MNASIEMPRYKSHKTVWALEIADVTGTTLTFADKGYAPVAVEPEMFVRYTPVAGDFLVEYEGGYKSISPRKAFLDGYTAEAKAKHEGLPVAGYKAQSNVAVDLVNSNKQAEEFVLRVLDELATMKGPAASNDKPSEITVDQRWLAIGRTAIEQGFMAVNRSIFKPGRVKLPGDPS